MRDRFGRVRRASLLSAGLFAATLGASLAFAPAAQAAPRTHDGFYFQGDLGFGYLSSSVDLSVYKIKYSGLSLPSQIFLGGTLGGGFVLGGGFTTDYVASPKGTLTSPNASTSVTLEGLSLNLIGIGPFMDYYVDPHGGLHFQAFVGYAALSASAQGQTSSNDPVGPLIQFGGGYDFWVADEWSIGVLGKLGYASLKQTGATASYSTITPGVLASFTFN